MSANLHVLAAQLSVAAIVLFIVVSLSRFSVFKMNVLDGSDSTLYSVSVVFSPFLYVDTDASILKYNGSGSDPFNNSAHSVWSKDMDLLPTCSEFGKVAVSAKCSITTDALECTKVAKSKPYTDDCTMVRGLWVTGAVLLGVAFVTIMWPIWTGRGSDLSRTIAASGAFMLSSAICFMVYTPLFITMLKDINSITHVRGITDVDNARHLLYSLSALLFFSALVIIFLSLMSLHGGSTPKHQTYSTQITSPLFYLG